MEPAQTFAKNLLKLPTAVPAIVSNLQKLSTYHEKVEDRRDRLAPLAYHTYDNFKYKTTWSVKAHTWVDPDMPLSKKEFNEYCWLRKDMEKLLPATCPLVFGTFGFLPLAVWMSNDGWLPSAFSDKKSLVETKLAYYEKYGCDLRQQIGPMLQLRLKRQLRGCFNTEHLFLHDELVESYRETFYSHYTQTQRDVRKCAHIKYFDRKPTVLLLTNKDPVELTEELEAQLNEIEKSAMSAAEKTDAINAAVREAYKKQELAGGPSTNAVPGMELPADNILLGENATEDNYIEPPEEVITLAELKVTGDRVVIPMEFRTHFEYWDREMTKQACEFLGLPFRFVSMSYNQVRIVKWYEEILQEDQLIKKEGGVQKLTDDELKVVLLDRAVMRYDEDLTRGDMEARWKEMNWLMEQKLSPFVILSWQTGFYRTTYSPEDDLPEPTILPKYNRSILDVDTHNRILPDEIMKPRPYVHPALYPNAHSAMAAEVAILSK
jgi:hypothetical protein|uniref:Uncharacterized protein n=1 Tax=Eutreptiella gymnastica TaxID=73025 RepID=A0A7S4G9Z0_9EUGL